MSSSDAVKAAPVKGEWSTGILDIGSDPAGALLGCCCPCVLYGMTAEKAHGGDCILHGLKFYLYSCFCGCGLVTGPTRKAVRDAYDLPIAPEFLKAQGPNADCLVGTIPCVHCFALCQDARELNNRAPTAPINPGPVMANGVFNWLPVTDAPPAAPAAATAAPVQVEMAM